MRIRSIKIKNFKCFDEKVFAFSESFTLLIGDNGTGKTSILEALTIGLGGFLNGIDDISSRNIQVDEVRRETEHIGDATTTNEKQFPVEIECVADIDGKELKWKRTLNSKNGKTTRHFAKQIISYANELQRLIKKEKRKDIILPILAYQSAGRTWSQKREKWEDPFQKEEVSRFLGYTDCLESESNIKLFVKWLRRMTFIQIQKQKNIGEMNSVLNAIKTFIQGLFDASVEVGIVYDLEEEEVMVNINENKIPLRMMSAGYQTVIGMVADIAYRMALLNPELKENAANETPGVVLIDELDLHLHPKWQWRIIKDLKRTFPKVQFIATTHAPIIIASCEDNELIHLYEKHGQIVSKSYQTPSGWSIEDVLTDLMGTVARSPETIRMIERMRNLYIKKIEFNLNNDEQEELNRINNHLAKNLPQGDPVTTLAKIDAIETELFGKE